VIPVVLSTTFQDLRNTVIVARRRRHLPIVSGLPVDEYVTRLAERRAAVRRTTGRAVRLRRAAALDTPRGIVSLGRWAVARADAVRTKAAVSALRGRQEGQMRFDRWRRRTWTVYDEHRRQTSLLATDRGTLPELVDIGQAFWRPLDQLAPDVIHAHHPLVLPAALRAARRLRSRGRSCRVLYDARENFAGIPEEEQGSPRRHAVLVRQEVRAIRGVDAVLTVSEPIADELHQRYGLSQRPAVILNVPVRATQGEGPTVRDAAGLGADVPLVVYSGGMSRARGIEVLVRALAALPDVHAVLVPVPHPHPMEPGLRKLSVEVGVQDRLHIIPPVGQDQLVRYLSGANVAIHPMPGGSANHDQALPNKLFEYLHARLPLVVSDARLMSEFVRRNDLGEVFRSGDAPDLARAIRQVLDVPPPADHLADLAQEFCWQGQEDAVLRVYAELAPLPSPPPERSHVFPSLDVTGEASAVDVTRAHLERIDAIDTSVHAFLHQTQELCFFLSNCRRRPALTRFVSIKQDKLSGCFKIRDLGIDRLDRLALQACFNE
jgi:glycosyltransferase involved in cell wall biosynthesis